MRLIWSPESRRNLLNIRECIDGQASVPRADAMIERIRAAARQVLTVPRAGRKIQPENRDDLRVTRARPFWILPHQSRYGRSRDGRALSAAAAGALERISAPLN